MVLSERSDTTRVLRVTTMGNADPRTIARRYHLVALEAKRAVLDLLEKNGVARHVRREAEDILSALGNVYEFAKQEQ